MCVTLRRSLSIRQIVHEKLCDEIRLIDRCNCELDRFALLHVLRRRTRSTTLMPCGAKTRPLRQAFAIEPPSRRLTFVLLLFSGWVRIRTGGGILARRALRGRVRAVAKAITLTAMLAFLIGCRAGTG